MSTTTVTGAMDVSMPTTPKSIASTRVTFMDNLRYLMVVLVIVYHAVAPHWTVYAIPPCFWNRANKLDQQLAATSHNTYLVHFFIVVALQMALLGWVGGQVKIAIVFLAALALSFGISYWILARHARAFVLVLIGFFVFCLIVRP